MDKARKKYHRLQIQAQQAVGRAERTDVLHSVSHVEDRVNKMQKAINNTSEKLSQVIRYPIAKDDGEKRRKKAHEYGLAKTLSESAKELETGADTNLLGQVMNRYGEAMFFVVSEMVKMEQDVDNSVVVRFNKFTEEVQNIRVQRDKMKRLTLDLDSAKQRLQQAKESAAEKEKMDTLQDSVDSAMNKVESCKDNLVAEMYTLAAKEVDVAQVFTLLIEYQVEYYRTVARVLSDTLPEIQRKIATHSHRPVFGCPLEDHLRYTGREIALALEVCCAALMQLGLDDEGIFRISGNAIKVRRLKAMFDAGEVELADYDRDPHAIAGALKSYLRDLPEPLMTHGLLKEWTAAGSLEGDARKEALMDVLSRLPPSNYCNLRYLMRFLSKVTDLADVNRMSIYNIAIVIGPNVLWNKTDGDNFLGSRLVECLLTHVDYFFPGDIQYTSNLIDSLNDRTGGFNGTPVTKRASPPQISASMHESYTEGLTPKRPKAPAPPPPKARPSQDDSNIVAQSGNSSPSSKRSDSSLNEYADEQDYAVPPDDPPPPSDPPPPQVVRRQNIQSQMPELYPRLPEGPISGHRKTNSLDRPMSGAVKVLPNPKRVSPTQLKEVNDIVVACEEYTKDQHPARPPPPSSEALQKNSAHRSSIDRRKIDRLKSWDLEMIASTARPVALLACGSFNPPTYMHLRMFELARDYVQNVMLRPVICGYISPTHNGYGKPGLAHSKHRAKMVQLAANTSDWIRVDTWECNQASWSRTLVVLKHINELMHKDNRKRPSEECVHSPASKSSKVENDKNANVSNESPTANGVRSKESPQLMLLCGADLLESFFKDGVWKEEDLECIVRDFGLIVISRAGSHPQQLIHKSDILTKYQRNIHVVNEWIHNEVSSSSIRQSLMRSESVKYLLPDSVLDYIKTNGLYTKSTSHWTYRARLEEGWDEDILVVEETHETDGSDSVDTIAMGRFTVHRVLSPPSDQPLSDGTVSSTVPPCYCKSPDSTINDSSSLVWQASPETVPMIPLEPEIVWHDSPAGPAGLGGAAGSAPVIKSYEHLDDVACHSDSGVLFSKKQARQQRLFKDKARTVSDTVAIRPYDLDKLRKQTQDCIAHKRAKSHVVFHTASDFISPRSHTLQPKTTDSDSGVTAPTWVYNPKITKSLPDIHLLSQQLPKPTDSVSPMQHNSTTHLNHLHIRVKALKISASPETTV